MFRFTKRAIATLTLFALLITPLAALAHEAVTAGNYTIEYGWLDEPPVAGKDNAIIINISGHADDSSHEEMEGAISLVSPADGGAIAGDSFEVSVQVEGLDEHAEGVHWHLYVDEKELVMAPVDHTTVTVNNLSNGAHTLKVALAGADHAEFGEPAQAAITVEGATGSGEPTVSGLDSAEIHGHDEADFHVDVSGLKLELVYGGQTIPLTLQPLHDGEPGQFTAPFKPDRPGLYTLKITGKLAGDFGETEVNAEVEPEEVEPGEAAPTAEPTASASSGLPTWLVIGGAVVVVAALGFGVFAFMRRK